MSVGLQESLLVHILRVLLVPQHVQRQPQNRTVVPAHQLVERIAFPALRLPDEFVILQPLLRTGFHLRWSKRRPSRSTCRCLRHCWRFYRDHTRRQCSIAGKTTGICSKSATTHRITKSCCTHRALTPESEDRSHSNRHINPKKVSERLPSAPVTGKPQRMAETVHVSAPLSAAVTRRPALWLAGISIGWMLVEAGVSVYAAVTAHSPVLLAFGSDSLVELLSATVVLLQWTPALRLSEKQAARIASILLYLLAGVVAMVAVAALLLHLQPETSRSGIAVTAAALVAMPVIAVLKRREATLSGNRALAADAAQSATCAYLAAIALIGLVVRASLGIVWFDSLAALAAIPLLIREARAAGRGESCGCC